jgi:hypothetical protein
MCLKDLCLSFFLSSLFLVRTDTAYAFDVDTLNLETLSCEG